jgi:hypothetical protein
MRGFRQAVGRQSSAARLGCSQTLRPIGHRTWMGIPMLRDYRTSYLFAKERCDSLSRLESMWTGSIT